MEQLDTYRASATAARLRPYTVTRDGILPRRAGIAHRIREALQTLEVQVDLTVDADQPVLVGSH